MNESAAPFEVPIAGGGVHGERLGAGPPIVCLHGLTATRRYVTQGSSLLARRGFELVSYDARGHGQSEPAPSAARYEYSDLVDDLRAVLDQLGLERVVLAGNSMGAATAMAFAIAEPERVAAMVQITPAFAPELPTRGPDATPGEMARWDARADALAAGDLDLFVRETGVDSLPPAIRESARLAVRQRVERHRHLDAVADALRVVPRSAAFDAVESLHRVELPVLVVASRDGADPEHPEAVAREYVDLLPDARLIIEDEGKSPLAWQGAQLSRAIDEWLSDVTPLYT